MVFPAGSVGARTPGAHDLETYGVLQIICGLTFSARPIRRIEPPEPPLEVEQPSAWPLNRPLQGPPVSGSFELQVGLLQNKFVCVLRSRFVNGCSISFVAKSSIG